MQKGMSMRKQTLALSTVLLASLFTPLPQQAQTTSTSSDHAKQNFAINLLRAINTAEVSYRHNHGEYALWAILVDSPEWPYGMHTTLFRIPQLDWSGNAR